MRRSRGVPAMLLLLLLLVSAAARPAGDAARTVTALFVLGDSLVDDGNNDALPGALARADYYPYGIDFPFPPKGLGAATGRFCNGKTVADALCDLLGLQYVPPYTSTTHGGVNATAAVLGGVNYASAAAGILDETGQHLGDRFSLSQQVVNLEATLDGFVRPLFGGDRRGYERHLARSVAVVVAGGNDYLNNYLLTPLRIGYDSGDRYRPADFAELLIDHYARQIMALHSLGLRKFLLTGIGPLGCTPGLRRAWAGTIGPRGQCAEQVNQMVGLFNRGLRSLVDQLNADHRRPAGGAAFVYGDTYAAVLGMIRSPGEHGFTVVDRGCCEVVQIIGGGLCLPLVPPCGDRERYVFWDAYHPTQAANLVLAQMAFAGTPELVYPLNLRQLAQL